MNFVSLISGIVVLCVIFILPFLLLLALAIILYFFTGEKKKADLILPHLMEYSLKVFAYIWMLIISFVALVPAFMVVNYIVMAIMGQGDYSSPNMIIIPLIILIALMLLIFGAMKLNRFVIKKSKRGSDITNKIIFSIGLIVHSLITFVSGLVSLASILNAIFGSSLHRSEVDTVSVSIFIVSLAASLVFYSKALQIFKREAK